ncbi:MAG: PorT family protein [Parafilimonas sp.]|nr:PorT family protein [Parafilimonas sp.]
MKKILFFCTLILGVATANAQFGIQAGVGLYSGKAKSDGVSYTYKTKPGFTAGIVYSAPLSGNISFMPSLNFTQKGGKYSESGVDDKLTLSYIDLPLNFVYNANGFFIGLGPDLAFGVGGKEKISGSGLSESNDIKFGSGDNADFKPFEISANILAGYKFDNGFFVTANYNPGISNIAPDNAGSNAKWHNSGFGIRVGFMIGGTKKSSND